MPIGKANPLRDITRSVIAAMKRNGTSDSEIAEHFTTQLGSKVSKEHVERYRTQNHIKCQPATFSKEAMTVGANKGSAIALANHLEAADFASIASDKGREAELFGGLRFGSIRFKPATRLAHGRPDTQSYVGCSAAWAAR